MDPIFALSCDLQYQAYESIINADLYFDATEGINLSNIRNFIRKVIEVIKKGCQLIQSRLMAFIKMISNIKSPVKKGLNNPTGGPLVPREWAALLDKAFDNIDQNFISARDMIGLYKDSLQRVSSITDQRVFDARKNIEIIDIDPEIENRLFEIEKLYNAGQLIVSELNTSAETFKKRSPDSYENDELVVFDNEATVRKLSALSKRFSDIESSIYKIFHDVDKDALSHCHVFDKNDPSTMDDSRWYFIMDVVKSLSASFKQVYSPTYDIISKTWECVTNTMDRAYIQSRNNYERDHPAD